MKVTAKVLQPWNNSKRSLITWNARICLAVLHGGVLSSQGVRCLVQGAVIVVWLFPSESTQLSLTSITLPRVLQKIRCHHLVARCNGYSL